MSEPLNRGDKAPPPARRPRSRVTGPRRPASTGFTLVELLVAIGVIAVLIGLLLPAVQAAREAARKAACQSNLRQLALAMQSYESVHSSFPIGHQFAMHHVLGLHSNAHGPITGLLPFLEQQAVHDALNIWLWDACPINNTAVSTAMGVLHCPSDWNVRNPLRFLEPSDPPGAPESERVEVKHSRTNYVFNTGMWPGDPYQLHRPLAQERLHQFGGVVGPVGYPVDFYIAELRGLGVPTIRVADVTDGLANTIAVMERRTFDSPEFAVPLRTIESSFTWSRGWHGQSLGCTYTPVNYYKAKRDPYVYSMTAAGVIGTSSLHPGGANVAFADGSARFLRETIDSWTISPTTGLPPGVTFDGLFRVSPGTRIPVYQALGSRAGGEVVSGDDY